MHVSCNMHGCFLCMLHEFNMQVMGNYIVASSYDNLGMYRCIQLTCSHKFKFWKTPLYSYALPYVMMNYSLTTAVRGYHIYKTFWMASLGEVLPCIRESSILHDPFAVAVRSGTNIVGHVPKKFLSLCALFTE